MTPSRKILFCLALVVAVTGAFSPAPAATNSSTSTANAKAKKTLAPPAPAPATVASAPSTNAPAEAAPPAPTFKLDDYIDVLKTELKLSDLEVKTITAYYVTDGDKLKQILNDDTLSPLQQAQQVADLRSERNDKISDLLHDLQRQHAFLDLEAQYRVALTELAANGGLVAAAK